ncbi:MAG: hypothetical protein IJJ43_03705 [Oscillospiraceae bacterium]|nr:hypothetical protein [Oscillospiraceae bacterium]
MKKTLRLTTKLLAIVLIIATLAGGVTAFAASTTQTLANAPDLYNYVCQGYNGGSKGPIMITRATLQDKYGLSKKTVYLVTLSGTDNVAYQATNVLTDIMVGLNLTNPLLDSASAAVLNAVPKGSNLIIAGHSLGGMVAQQLAASSKLKSNYNILNTVTFGSPLISAGLQEGKTCRLGDKADVVPYLSVNTFILPIHAIISLKTERSGFLATKAHTESYRSSVWNSYDVLGNKGGNMKLILEVKTRAFFKAPNYFGLPY